MLPRCVSDAISFGGLVSPSQTSRRSARSAAVLLALARGKADASALEQSGGIGVAAAPAAGARAVRAGSRRRPAARAGPARARVELAARNAGRAHRAPLARPVSRRVLLAVVFFVLSVGHRGLCDRLPRHARAGRARAGALCRACAVRAAGGSREARHRRSRRRPVPQVGPVTPVLRGSGYVTGERRPRLHAARPARPERSRRSTAGAPTSRRARRRSSAGCCGPRPRRSCGGSPARSATTLTLPLTIAGDPLGLTLDRREPARRLHAAQARRARPRTHTLRPCACRRRRGAARSSRSAFRSPCSPRSSPATARAVPRFRSPTPRPARLSLGRLRAGETPLPRFTGWFGTSGIRVDGDALPLRPQPRRRLGYPAARAARGRARPRDRLTGVARAAGPSGVAAAALRESGDLAQRSSQRRATSRRSTATSSSPTCRRG